MKMKNMVFLVLLIVSLTCNANASDPWLDEVISFDQPTGSSNDGGIPTDALGAPDAGNGLGFVSIDIPETLILAFTDNSAIDGIGNDIRIYEQVNGDSSVYVYASMDNVNYVYLGHPNGNVEYDIANYPDLNIINYLKFIGLDNGGASAGFELDAVEAINSDAPTVCLNPCKADFDKDGDCDGDDLSSFLTEFGKTDCEVCSTQLYVPIYGQGQQDQIWKDDQLGTCVPETLASDGCAVTSIAMVFKYYGIETNPRDLNDWLTQNDGYANGCEVRWEIAADSTNNNVLWFGRFDYQNTPANLDVIRNEINNGYPVIAEVRLEGFIHFVVITGYSNDIFYINDPWHAESSTIIPWYGDDPAVAIHGLMLYHKK